MEAAPFGENRLWIEGTCSPLAAKTQESDTTLLDLRSQVAFASGFIPGSFHFPDIHCLELLRANGLLKGRRIYAVADEPEQIARCSEILASGMELEFGTWSSPKTANCGRAAARSGLSNCSKRTDRQSGSPAGKR